MRFSEVIGNEDLKRSLVRMVRAGRLGHAILLTEEGGGGGFAFALALAQYVNCHELDNPNPDGNGGSTGGNGIAYSSTTASPTTASPTATTPTTATPTTASPTAVSPAAQGDSCGECPSCNKYRKLIHPDLHFVFPVSSGGALSESEKKAPVSDYFLQPFKELALRNPYFTEQELYDAIGIENKSGLISVHEARRIFEKLSFRAAEGRYKTMVVFLPEKMNAEAASKLLKLLEEPPQGTLFLLVSQHPERLLPTIRSRCQTIALKPLSREERRRAAGPSSADNPEYREIAVSIVAAGLDKSLAGLFRQWEMLAELGREKQREWLLYMESYIRKTMLVANGLEAVADLAPEEEATVRDFAARIRPTFYEKAFAQLESALGAVAANVNAKLIFCDLCNRIMLAI